MAELQGFGAKSRKIPGWHRFAKEEPRKNKLMSDSSFAHLKERVSESQGNTSRQQGVHREEETIGDLDLVVSDSRNQKSVIESVLNLPGIADVKGAGNPK